jgi:transcriptional regulator with XRE-family HTH domain
LEENPLTTPPEPIGKRIARMRTDNNWTQQALATRLALSRVAVSHIELDLILPGERTIVLLAGLFKVPPCELVAGTTYPQAKAEKLPANVCYYTALELEIQLLDNDLAWLERLDEIIGTPAVHPYTVEISDKWVARLAQWYDQSVDEDERRMIAQARARLPGVLSPGR